MPMSELLASLARVASLEAANSTVHHVDELRAYLPPSPSQSINGTLLPQFAKVLLAMEEPVEEMLHAIIPRCSGANESLVGAATQCLFC